VVLEGYRLSGKGYVSKWIGLTDSSKTGYSPDYPKLVCLEMRSVPQLRSLDADLFSNASTCPNCGSKEIERVRRQAFKDWFLAWFFRVRPHRCDVCDKKFYKVPLQASHRLP
jgi:hypothetical protein